MAEFERRINIVYEMILSGLRRFNIISECKKLKWNVTDRQIDNYISKAREIIEQINQDDRKFILNKILAQYESLYLKSLKVQDIKTCVSILEKKSKMLGIAEPKTDDGNDNTIEFIHKIVR